MGKRISLAAAALAVSLCSASAASAATEWDYYSFTGVTHPITKYQMAFAAEVEKRTNGQLKITVRPAGELPFRIDEAGRIVGEGLVQMSSAYGGFLAGIVPIAGIGGHPFLVRTFQEGIEVWPIIDKYTRPEFEKLGAKTLFHFYWPPQNLFGTGPQIKTAADFEGRKIRTTDPKQAELISRLGGSSVTLATAEVPVAMQRGLMEGVLTATFNVVGAKWTDFIDWAWYADINVGGPNFELVNLKAYNALPPDVRKTLDEVAAEWSAKMNKEIEALEAAEKKTLTEKYGIEIYDAPPETVDEIVAKVSPYWDEWAKQNGPNAVAMMKEIRAAVGR